MPKIDGPATGLADSAQIHAAKLRVNEIPGAKQTAAERPWGAVGANRGQTRLNTSVPLVPPNP